jgi:hypothetical protein
MFEGLSKARAWPLAPCIRACNACAAIAKAQRSQANAQLSEVSPLRHLFHPLHRQTEGAQAEDSGTRQAVSGTARACCELRLSKRAAQAGADLQCSHDADDLDGTIAPSSLVEFRLPGRSSLDRSGLKRAAPPAARAKLAGRGSATLSPMPAPSQTPGCRRERQCTCGMCQLLFLHLTMRCRSVSNLWCLRCTQWRTRMCPSEPHFSTVYGWVST